MAHYVKQMNDDAIERIYENKAVDVFHQFKRELERGEYVLNKGTPAEISALDLLWQGNSRYDQIGHAFWACVVWNLIVGHPHGKSAAFKVGGNPAPNSQGKRNNELLSKAAGPFSAVFLGDNTPGDGTVTAKPEAGFRNPHFMLEVGDVSPESLYYHVRHGYGFARWPYSSQFVYLFEVPQLVRVMQIDELISEHEKLCFQCSPDHKGPREPMKEHDLYISKMMRRPHPM